MILYFDLVVTTADGFASTFCFFTVMAEFKNVVLMEVNGAFWSNKRPEGEEWEDSKALKKSYLFIKKKKKSLSFTDQGLKTPGSLEISLKLTVL